MKSQLLITFLFSSLLLFSQNQEDSNGKYDYLIDGHVLFGEYDLSTNIINTTAKKWVSGHYRYNIIGENTFSSGSNEFEYYLLKILPFKNKFIGYKKNNSNITHIITQSIGSYKIDSIFQTVKISLNKDGSKKMDTTYSHMSYSKFKKNKATVYVDEVIDEVGNITITKDSVDYANVPIMKYTPYKKDYIDVDDENKIFWIKKESFEKQLENGYIKKRYHLNPELAYGASLSIPFKIRPSIGDINMKITPELSLGGFIGGRFRLNRFKNVFLYLPVVTAGVTTIGINTDNIISEENTTQTTTVNNAIVKDGLVFARTFSVGSFIEYNSFQFGFVLGWDKGGGEVAKDWIYNDQLWYSFSIGYNFLRKADDK
jgi:hypothetical protein